MRRYNKDITGCPRSMRRLRDACESAMLESTTHVSIELASLLEGVDFYSSITLVHFVELNAELFRRCLVPVEKVGDKLMLPDTSSTRISTLIANPRLYT